MLVDLHLLKLEHIVSLSEFAVILFGLHGPVHFLVSVTVNITVESTDLSREVFVELQLLFVTLSSLLGLRGELVVMDLELFVKLFNFANKDEFHAFKLFDVSILSLFTESLEVLRHL